jgi:hypothetical protein
MRIHLPEETIYRISKPPTLRSKRSGCGPSRYPGDAKARSTQVSHGLPSQDGHITNNDRIYSNILNLNQQVFEYPYYSLGMLYLPALWSLLWVICKHMSYIDHFGCVNWLKHETTSSLSRSRSIDLCSTTDLMLLGLSEDGACRVAMYSRCQQLPFFMGAMMIL